MGNVFRSLAIVTTLAVILAGCQSAEDKLTAAGAVPLTQAETISHISGNTEIWTKGGGYYSSDGTLAVKWKGSDGSGTWKVTEDGKVCLNVDIWGGSIECHHYVNNRGTITLIYMGNPRVAEIRSGNQLDSL